MLIKLLEIQKFKHRVNQKSCIIWMLLTAWHVKVLTKSLKQSVHALSVLELALS